LTAVFRKLFITRNEGLLETGGFSHVAGH
jgi:hypothetical protein